MAAPFVAGSLALLAAARPDLPQSALRDALLASAPRSGAARRPARLGQPRRRRRDAPRAAGLACGARRPPSPSAPPPQRRACKLLAKARVRAGRAATVRWRASGDAQRRELERAARRPPRRHGRQGQALDAAQAHQPPRPAPLEGRRRRRRGRARRLRLAQLPRRSRALSAAARLGPRTGRHGPRWRIGARALGPEDDDGAPRRVRKCAGDDARGDHALGARLPSGARASTTSCSTATASRGRTPPRSPPACEALGPEQLAAAGRRRDAIFVQQGITFDTTGEDGPTLERPMPLDLVPRILPAGEWTQIKRGIAQRIRALNRFVDDVYHAREIVRAGIVPWRLVVSRSHFARAAHGIRPPGGVYCHVAGCDLVRDDDGSWKVLEDNVRTPSGISYVLENRTAMTRLVPQLFAEYRVRPVDHYPQLLLAALRAVAPAAEGEATVVVWTPGPAELRLLRARVPRAPDGRRARRGLRPRRARRRAVHAHDAGPAARARRLPPPRRRLRRPARVPSRLRARRARASCAPTARARSRSPTPSAPASPTTRRSTTGCRR